MITTIGDNKHDWFGVYANGKLIQLKMNPSLDPHKTNEELAEEGKAVIGFVKFLKAFLAIVLLTAALIGIGSMSGCRQLTFEGSVEGMKRPIVVVGKNCNEHYKEYSTRCSVVLRDSTGRMEALNEDQFANVIANSYNVGDTLK